MVTAETYIYPMFEMFYSCEITRLRKHLVLPIEIISVSCTTKECNNVTTKTLLSNFHSIICQVVTYGRLQTKENVKLLTLKVVAVTYERWLPARDSKYMYILYGNVTWKLSTCTRTFNWKTGCEERWSLTKDSHRGFDCTCIYNETKA